MLFNFPNNTEAVCLGFSNPKAIAPSNLSESFLYLDLQLSPSAPQVIRKFLQQLRAGVTKP